MFNELFTEAIGEMDSNNVIQDKDLSRWGISNGVRKFGERYGELKAVFNTKYLSRQERYGEYWCFDISKNEDLRKFPKPGSGWEIMRYVTLRSLAGEMAPVVAINKGTGQIKFLKDYEAELEDSEWDRPLKVDYMRYIK